MPRDGSIYGILSARGHIPRPVRNPSVASQIHWEREIKMFILEKPSVQANIEQNRFKSTEIEGRHALILASHPMLTEDYLMEKQSVLKMDVLHDAINKGQRRLVMFLLVIMI